MSLNINWSTLKRRDKIDLTGVTIEDVISLTENQINQLTGRQLQDLVNRAVSSTNKLIRRAYDRSKKSGYDLSPAVRGLENVQDKGRVGLTRDKQTGQVKFTTNKTKVKTKPRTAKSKISATRIDKRKLKRTLIKLTDFNRAKTSTAKGHREYIKAVNKLTPKSIRGNVDKEREFWNNFRHWNETSNKGAIYDSDRAIKWARNEFNKSARKNNSKFTLDNMVSQLDEEMQKGTFNYKEISQNVTINEDTGEVSGVDFDEDDLPF